MSTTDDPGVNPTTGEPIEPPGIEHETSTELTTEEGTHVEHGERTEVTPAPEPESEQAHGDSTPDDEE
jgi:hypothetical protein